MNQEVRIGPNHGPQSKAFASASDITVYGGQAGGGKTYLTLLRFGVHAHRHDGYYGVIFRREMPMVTVGGGMWEESMRLYPIFGAKPNSASYQWRFPNRSLVQFRSLQHEKDMIDYQGAQLSEFCFEEATHFTEAQFWYLFGRLREMQPGSMRARCMLTCNPDPDSWVRQLIDWYIGADGLAIRERAGVRRWFMRHGDTMYWGDTPEAVRAQAPGAKGKPQSLRFIPASLEDNPRGDPNYEAKLESLPRVERERLRGGNWNVRAVAGSYFKRHYFPVVEAVPGQVVASVRGWDLAATEPSATNPDPDWTVGVKLALLADGRYVVEHVVRERVSPGKVERLLRVTAEQDGIGCVQAYWEDPAQAGKVQKHGIVQLLGGFRVLFERAAEDKETYAGPPSSDAEHGKFLMVRGPWNDAFLGVLEGFPAKNAKKDDVDALSRAHRALCNPGLPPTSFSIDGL